MQGKFTFFFRQRLKCAILRDNNTLELILRETNLRLNVTLYIL